MPLSDLVNVNVSLTSPGVTRAGFGVPLIVSHSATWPERVRSYTTLAGVLVDFAVTTPEYLAAQAVFAQSPRPVSLMIGRAAGVPTEVQAIAVASVLNSTVYQVRAFFAGVSQTIAITSGGSATNDAIVTAIVNALNNLATPAWVASTAYTANNRVLLGGNVYLCTGAGTSAGSGGPTGTGSAITDGTVTWQYLGTAAAFPNSNFSAASTGSSGSKVATCTAGTAGNWFVLEPLSTNTAGAVADTLTISETTANPSPTIQADLAAIAAASANWYAFSVPFKSSALVAAAAAWAETNQKLFCAGSADTLDATQALGTGTDTLQTLKASSYTRTFALFHPRQDEFMDAAVLGRFLPLDPGTDNWRLKTLVGVTPVVYTATQQANIQNKLAGFYYVLGGVNVLGGAGISPGNEYIDVVRFIDWWVANVSADIATVLIQSNKIAFTDAGISVIESQIRAVNQQGVAIGGINPGSPPGIPAPSVTVPKAGAVSTSDRQARKLTGVTSSWTLAGAINSVTVNATILS